LPLDSARGWTALEGQEGALRTWFWPIGSDAVYTRVLAISLVTFAYYGIDKWLSKAHRFRARVPELILNLLAVFGGAPGAWLGRALFRHKTNLRRHWLMFAILVASSLLEVYVLHTLYSGTLPLG
jgi:uncharacterized membrane protein YsdA (DUF1294 family)